MKGLIIKDILNLKSYIKQLLLVLVFFTIYGFAMNNGAVVAVMFVVFTSMTVITSMGYDEKANWNKYALTMNITRKDIVASKYVFFILSIIIGFIIGIISSLGINVILKETLNIEELLISSMVSTSVFIIVYSIIIPIIFKIGTEKARIIMIAIFFIPSIIVYLGIEFFKDKNIPIPDENTLMSIIYIIPVITIVVLFISYKISINIFSKKEF